MKVYHLVSSIEGLLEFDICLEVIEGLREAFDNFEKLKGLVEKWVDMDGVSMG